MPLYIWLMLLSSQLALLLHSSVASQEPPRHMQIAKGYVGTVEKTGHNDGAKIEWIIKSEGGATGSSYCSYFVSKCLDSAKVKEPTIRSGLARNFITKKSIPANDVLIGKTKIPEGTILIFQKGNTINGHIGFVKSWNKQYGNTIEGNTSSGQTGSQADGDGIWERKRKIEPTNYFRITSFTLVKY